MSRFSDMIRKSFGEGDAKRDAGLKTPSTVKRFDNISYGTHPTWNLLDVYRPKKAKETALPVIAIVHGGAWVYGDKDVYQYYGMSLAERGFAVVNFSYRLAPEFQYPTDLEDICAAFRWIFANASEYGFDTANIFAVGDSAGAHLLSMFANFLTNPECKKAMKAEFEKLWDNLKNIHTNKNGEQYDTTGTERATTETAEEFMNIIMKLMFIPDITVELCGSWIWVSGNTKEHKDLLKELPDVGSFSPRNLLYMHQFYRLFIAAIQPAA